MNQLQALSLARKLVLGGGVLLLIDTFLKWQTASFAGVEVASRNAWHGFWGVLLGLMTIALVAWVIARMFGIQLPEGMPEGLISLILGGLILLFVVLKILTDDADTGWAAWVGIVLAAVVAYGTWRNFQDSGESLPSMPKAATAGAAPAAPAAPPTPPAAPPPPAETEPPTPPVNNDPA